MTTTNKLFVFRIQQAVQDAKWSDVCTRLTFDKARKVSDALPAQRGLTAADFRVVMVEVTAEQFATYEQEQADRDTAQEALAAEDAVFAAERTEQAKRLEYRSAQDALADAKIRLQDARLALRGQRVFTNDVYVVRYRLNGGWTQSGRYTTKELAQMSVRSLEDRGWMAEYVPATTDSVDYAKLLAAEASRAVFARGGSPLEANAAAAAVIARQA